MLTTTIQSFSTRIDGLQGEIEATQQRLDRAQSSLDRQKDELLEVRDRLEVARDRLERLRSELATARRVLAARLVEIYKSDTPDALTVVLEADGFADLLERTEFLERISDQDREITDRVRGLRDQAEDQAVELAKLEEREQLAAERILRERDQIASRRTSSSRRATSWPPRARTGAARSPGARRAAGRRWSDLASLEAEQARVAAALSGAARRGPDPAGLGSADLALNGPVPASFGEARPGHMHAGIDIAMPEARRSARPTAAGWLMGWIGGYGNYTCIQHTGSLSTCYAHQSSFATSNGPGGHARAR